MLPKAFSQKIQAALDDPFLQTALDANAERRIRARQQAWAELPDIAQRRQRMHSLRLEVVRNLEVYAEQFVRKVQENGVAVHRAANASEAVAIILGIIHQHGARRVAKSKTMVSEEIELNTALQSAGIEVVETDLGEYIVQLRGERPAHLITPAVHLRRSDVARTFSEKLGAPYSEDIPTMTALARRRLRQVFLQADIGLSGVNFGVAETGTMCILSNEGNGRMVSTIPPVHIALMGLERIVPTLKDLALCLSVLPRSATGQKLTVYTSLLQSPRRPGEVDGPLERHLVLVDNGRLVASRGALHEALSCIRCGACLNACPIFRELGGHAYVGKDGIQAPYGGPIGSVISPLLLGNENFSHLARASSLCGACRDACPVDIDLPGLLLRVRAGAGGAPGQPMPVKQPSISNAPIPLRLGLRLFGWLAASSLRFQLAQKAVGLMGAALAPRSAWLRLPAFTGWGYSKDFPRPARRTFHDLFPGLERQPEHIQPFKMSQPEESHFTGTASVSEQAGLVDSFKANWLANGGMLVMCKQTELPDRLREIYKAKSGGQPLKLAGFTADMPACLAEFLWTEELELTEQPDAVSKIGLTGVIAASANPAALLVASGVGRTLWASLLPEIHVAIVRTNQIVTGLEELITLPAVRESSNAALVTGPSRTADIEMTLTVGVHGPREVVVFLLSE